MPLHIISVTPGKKSSAAWNNQPSYNANRGQARDQERRKDREGSSNYSHFLTPIWFGCRHCLWTHLETLLYNYSLTHSLMGPNKRGRGLTYHSLMNSCHHFLLLGCWNEHELPLIVVLCQVFSFQQPGHTCWVSSTSSPWRWSSFWHLIIKLSYRNQRTETPELISALPSLNVFNYFSKILIIEVLILSTDLVWIDFVSMSINHVHLVFWDRKHFLWLKKQL